MELCYNLTMKARPYNDDSISLTTLFFCTMLYCIMGLKLFWSRIWISMQLQFHNNFRKLSVSFFFICTYWKMGKVKGNISLNYRCMNRNSNLRKLWPHCVIVHSTGIACHGAIIFNITILTLSVVTADCVSYDCFLWLIWYLFNHFVTFHSIWLYFQILQIIF